MKEYPMNLQEFEKEFSTEEQCRDYLAKLRYENGLYVCPKCGGLKSLQGSLSKGHIAYYFDEFTFRFNRRKSKSRGMLFYRLLQNAVNLEPVTYENIIKK
jgi:hypothetical protein